MYTSRILRIVTSPKVSSSLVPKIVDVVDPNTLHRDLPRIHGWWSLRNRLGSERSPFRTPCRSTGNLDGPQSRVPQIVDLPSLRAESMVLLRRSRLGHSDSRGRRS